jgi:hypothetical protein
MTNNKPCMGGFCALREKCRHYVSPGDRQRMPAERLCANGFERDMFFMPLKNRYGVNKGKTPQRAYSETEAV